MAEQNVPPHIQAQIDAQAPARRFGGCLEIVIVLVFCACAAGVWYLIAGENINRLGDSISLQGKGVTTTGTVTSVEKFEGRLNGNPSVSYKVTVSFEVDGVTYTVTGEDYYKAD